jgi:hypothetical protein
VLNIEGEIHIPLPRDHSELCRFAGPNDIGYRDISSRIRILAENAAVAVTAGFVATQAAGKSHIAASTTQVL